MILVDACVWIDHLANRRTAAVQFLESLGQSSEAEVCVSGIVYFEVLRGISQPTVRYQVSRVLDRFERRDFRHDSYGKILDYDLLCRKRGLTQPKLGDWLIIQTAIDHDLEILSSDKDFVDINRHVPFKLIHLL